MSDLQENEAQAEFPYEEPSLQPNEVQVGFPHEQIGEQKWFVEVNQPDGSREIQPRSRTTMRVEGVRIMQADMLGRVGRWLGQNGFAEAVPYVTGWINPTAQEPPSPEHARELAAKLRDAMGKGSWKDDSYLEAAEFCVGAWAR